MLQLIDTGALRFPERHEIARERRPVATEGPGRPHFPENPDKAQPCKEEEKVSLPLQPAELVVIPFIGFDLYDTFPFLMDIVAFIGASRPHQVVELGSGIRGRNGKESLVEVRVAGKPDGLVNFLDRFTGKPEHEKPKRLDPVLARPAEDLVEAFELEVLLDELLDTIIGGFYSDGHVMRAGKRQLAHQFLVESFQPNAIAELKAQLQTAGDYQVTDAFGAVQVHVEDVVFNHKLPDSVVVVQKL